MVDIYNEEGYIINVIKNGFSDKWIRDVKLMTRFWKQYEGMKKKAIKTRIKEKCAATKLQKGADFDYDEFFDFDRLNRAIDSAYNSNEPLRAITYIDIPKEVVDWFLKLEKDFTITEEQVKYIKDRRKIKFDETHPINFERTKYLFTLYIWSKVQEGYIEQYNFHKLSKYQKRFKEDALLKPSFNMTYEKNLLYDLGLIGITIKNTIVASFLEKYDVFKTPITEENKIRILTGQPTSVPDEVSKNNLYDEQYMTLYNPGYWLTVQKYGTFKCQECNKEFIHYTTAKTRDSRKYCKECAIKVAGKERKNRPLNRWCKCCGYEFTVKDSRSVAVFCPECQSEINNAISSKNYARAEDIKNGVIRFDRQELIKKKQGIRVCVDCGKTFQVSPTNHNTTRCPECRELHQKELHRLSQQKYIENKGKE